MKRLPGLSLKNISFSFTESPLFENISLDMDEENPVVILGPSGCGKTTLLRLIAGLLEPRSGEIRLGGEPGKIEKVSFIFQEPRLLPWYKVLENVMLPIEGPLGKEEAGNRARYFLEMVSLGDKTGAYPDELSGGERQRVSMARAFAYPGSLILLDEPFQSLDIPLRLELMDILLDLIKKEKRRALTVTHDPREAVYLGERILVLTRPPGGIVLDKRISLDPTERTYGSPAHGKLERLLLKTLAEGSRMER
ncbi:MAG: ABC transporter ATP-binding protein [Spirochaetaceae bacterium]|jgi:NitT/TauT family transport system ATP-binding protein|nr:ABC transporter ATP-binding protein [Spirochaetaceae bacterium]